MNLQGAEWRGQNTPKRGDHVDFDINPEGKAVQVFTALSSSNPIYNLSEQLDKISNQDQAESQFNMIDWFVKCLKTMPISKAVHVVKSFGFLR